MRPRFVLVGVAIAAAVAASCESRDDPSPVTAYEAEVRSLLDARCLRCHAEVAPAAGWSAASYRAAIGCTERGVGVTVPSAGGAVPLLAVLDRPSHQGHLSAGERSLLASWVRGGTSFAGGGVHAAAFADPRSPESHGNFLRRERYAPMLDSRSPDACGACHDGAPARPARVVRGAPGAPACTSCHAEPDGAFACGTCHGAGARGYPPRDPCFFPGPAERAHAVHADTSASRASGLPCATCHPSPAPGKLDGAHANGTVEVALASPGARWDAATRRCSGTCHARGGARPEPSWEEAAMTCNDCHLSPPRDHYRGACTSCHREADAAGTKLVRPVLHANGVVDLGDGSGRCGACHGAGDSPWPQTGAHAAHAAPAGARAVACETCHELPAAKHPLGTGAATVRFAALAVRGGRRATYDPSSKTCAGTYCHEGAGGSNVAPRWDAPGSVPCGGCHSSPPSAPHVQGVTSCAGATCHEGRTNGLSLTAAGARDHVDGFVDRAVR